MVKSAVVTVACLVTCWSRLMPKGLCPSAHPFLLEAVRVCAALCFRASPASSLFFFLFMCWSLCMLLICTVWVLPLACSLATGGPQSMLNSEAASMAVRGFYPNSTPPSNFSPPTRILTYLSFQMGRLRSELEFIYEDFWDWWQDPRLRLFRGLQQISSQDCSWGTNHS